MCWRSIVWLSEPVAGAAEALKDQMEKAGLPAEAIATKILKVDKTRVMAGSAVLHAVLVAWGETPSWEPDDFDVFCVGLDPMRELGDLGFMPLLAGDDQKSEYTGPGQFYCHTIADYMLPESTKRLQTICHERLEHHPYGRAGPTDVLYQVSDFDFDILKIYFDGENVWMSKAAASALEENALGINRYVEVSPRRLTRFVGRIEKYLSRGFDSPPERISTEHGDRQEVENILSKWETTTKSYKHVRTSTDSQNRLAAYFELIRCVTKSASKR